MDPAIIAAIIGAVATIVGAIIGLKRKGINPPPPSKRLQREIFNSKDEWEIIEKIGNWKIHYLTSQIPTIIGSGMYSYLLSKNEYGKRNFNIHCKIRFFDYAIHANRGGETGASSFILGWINSDDGHKYFNLVFTGNKVIFEAVGFNEKSDYLDSRHLHEGASFPIIEGKTYDFVISSSKETLEVFVDGHSIYLFSLEKPIYGKVGLRPWRAKIECDYFEVCEM